MKNLMIRTHTFTMLTSRLVGMVLFAALLSAAPFHAALAKNAPNLGAEEYFAVLGGSAVTCTDSVVIGDVGVDLGGAVTQTNCTISGTVHEGDTVAQQAYDDFLAEYDAFASLEQCNVDLTGQPLGGYTLTPGVYCFDAAVTETGGVLTLDGSSNDIWIFKIGTGGTGALTGTNFSVVMAGGEAYNNNVFWWTAEAATLTDSVFIGSILAGMSITVTRGSLDGQALAKAAVTLTNTEVVSVFGTPIAPTVSSTDPANGDTGVALNKRVSATFSESMDPLTITNVNFTLTDGVTPATGTVAYVGLSATFTPDRYLALNTTYTATITTVAKDLAGNALASDKVWSFTTITTVAAGPQPVNLGTAGNFVILAKSGVSTTGTTAGTTAVVGDIGVSPAAATYITGFGLIADSSNTFSTSSLVTGKVYAADYAPPTPANMTTAVSDMETAFTDAAGRTLPDATELGAGDISGMTLAPGLYKWGTGVLITSAGVTLSGGANDVWIFQIAQGLTVANGAIVTLSGGAQTKNIFWQVSGQATLGTAADFKGIILSQTLISLNTGAVMNGRALAQTAVTLIANAITEPN